MTTAVATPVVTPIRTVQIDPVHSEATFQVRHLISRVRGRFDDFTGTIDFDEDTPGTLVGPVHDPGREHRHRSA